LLAAGEFREPGLVVGDAGGAHGHPQGRRRRQQV